MPTPLTRTLRAVSLAILILIPLPAHTETVVIPVSLSYPQLRFLVVREMFKEPDNTARYVLDDTGCAVVTYSEPHLSAEDQLLRVDVTTLASIDVDKIPQEGPEPALSAVEMEQLEQTYRTWDAFLTFAVKQAATATQSEALRSALLEILLDARYEMQAVLVADANGNSDPVKKLIIRSWERLEPVMREISVQSPEQNPVPFLSFMTAADALMTLDRLGPAAGLDISADGLRRLARLLKDNPTLDPLQFLDEIDPELQKLFDIGISEEIGLRKKPQGFNLQLVPFACLPMDPLNRLSRLPPSGRSSAIAPAVKRSMIEILILSIRCRQLSSLGCVGAHITRTRFFCI